MASGHRDLAYRAACESFVLLKNEPEVLPFKPGRKIAVIGPLADSRKDLLGSWKGDGEWENSRRSSRPSGAAMPKGCGCTRLRGQVRESNWFRRGARGRAADPDLAVLVMGESSDMSGEAKSRTDIGLPGVQTELWRQIRALGKPTVLVLLNGRPLILEDESRLADAILEVWFPGSEGARAIADVLFEVLN